MSTASGGSSDATLRITGPGITTDELRLLVAQAAGDQTPAAVAANVFDDLVAELGDRQQVARFLSGVATENEWPIIVNLGAKAVCIPPADWSAERTADFVAGVHESLTAEFGAITAATPDDFQR